MCGQDGKTVNPEGKQKKGLVPRHKRGRTHSCPQPEADLLCSKLGLACIGFMVACREAEMEPRDGQEAETPQKTRSVTKNHSERAIRLAGGTVPMARNQQTTDSETVGLSLAGRGDHSAVNTRPQTENVGAEGAVWR